jgi:hypothetical protein
MAEPRHMSLPTSAVKGKTLKGGSITVIHTPERDDSQRRLLAEVLARRCDALLLLTATPHDGHDRSFASLCALLDPSLVDGRGALRETGREGAWYEVRLTEEESQHAERLARGESPC